MFDVSFIVFKIEEEQISAINIRINELENSRPYLDAKERWKKETEQAKAELSQALSLIHILDNHVTDDIYARSVAEELLVCRFCICLLYTSRCV